MSFIRPTCQGCVIGRRVCFSSSSCNVFLLKKKIIHVSYNSDDDACSRPLTITRWWPAGLCTGRGPSDLPVRRGGLFPFWINNQNSHFFFEKFQPAGFCRNHLPAAWQFFNPSQKWISHSHSLTLTCTCASILFKYTSGPDEFDAERASCRLENKESALWLPVASHSVPMGVH